jgi:hypothetical protein
VPGKPENPEQYLKTRYPATLGGSEPARESGVSASENIGCANLFASRLAPTMDRRVVFTESNLNHSQILHKFHRIANSQLIVGVFFTKN